MFDQGNDLTVEGALARLGLQADAPPSALPAAYQRAIQSARGADDHATHERYREIIDAYRVLKLRQSSEDAANRKFGSWPSILELTPAEAITGGAKVGRLPAGRPFETRIPPGLRDGDLVWVCGWLLQVRIDEGDDLAVRGDDIWITARKPEWSLKAGSRVMVETPLGSCSFRLSREAVDARLARAPGLGLPASRGHATGDLYVRFVVENRPPNPAELLKRLTGMAA